MNESVNHDKMLVTVIPARPVAKGYTYCLPSHMAVAVGDIVLIPFGQSRALGVVESLAGQMIDPEKCKDILAVADVPSIDPVNIDFAKWVAQYTLSSLGQVIKMMIPVRDILKEEPASAVYELADGVTEKVKTTQKRKAVIRYLNQVGQASTAQIKAATNISPSVVSTMVKAGLLTKKMQSGDLGIHTIVHDQVAQPILLPAQQKAADQLLEALRSRKYSTTLLDGVTGSGKTEVYLSPVREALRQDRQCLILVPEIALTAQFIDRFTERFGVAPAVWHSTMTSAQRRKTYKGILSGEVTVVVGARSALFLPFPDLAMIIVDEEHDGSYKQEEGVFYHARDMAVKRAQMGDIPIILVSATPSLESHINALEGRYQRVHLPDRHGGAQMPDIHLVDMRKEKIPRTQFISPTLLTAAEGALERGEQVMLYLNRRGYAPLTLCRTCGYRLECPRCTAWLVQHHHGKRLLCHHCGHQDWLPTECPKCEDTESFVPCGPGVERIRDEIIGYFPDKKLAVLSSDAQKTPALLRETLQEIERGEVDLIIGTQIIAKGHHFPNLTVVGVIDADLGLSGGDLRAAERTYQLLHQVAGRAGREEKKGHVFLQSFMPEQRVTQALAKDERDEFLMVEALERQQGGLPPFGRLVSLIVSSEDEATSLAQAQNLARHAVLVDGVQVLGPAPAPIYKLRHRYRHRLLLRAGKHVTVQKITQQWIAQTPKIKGARIKIDIDPYSFM